MLGYIKKSDAIAEGFTHHGRYYFIPLYMTDPELSPEFVPMICTKFAPFELLMSAFHVIEGFVASMSGQDHMFAFQIGGRLDGKEESE